MKKKMRTNKKAIGCLLAVVMLLVVSLASASTYAVRPALKDELLNTEQPAMLSNMDITKGYIHVLVTELIDGEHYPLYHAEVDTRGASGLTDRNGKITLTVTIINQWYMFVVRATKYRYSTCWIRVNLEDGSVHCHLWIYAIKGIDVGEQEQVVAEEVRIISEGVSIKFIGIHVVVYGAPIGGGDRYPLEGAFVKVGLGLGVVSGHTDSSGKWYGSIPYPFGRPYIVQASKEGYFGKAQLVFLVVDEVVSCSFTLAKRLFNFNQQNSQQVNIS